MPVLPFLALLTPLAGAMSGGGSPPNLLLINEIRIDQPGSDLDEYFELLVVPANASLDGLTYVVIGDGAGGSGTIEAIVDLSGASANSLGLLVAAEGTFSLGTPDLATPLNFENSDNVTHLIVDGFFGTLGDDLDVDDDGVLDVTPWFDLLDAVSLVETDTPDLMNGEEYAYAASLGFPEVGPDGSFVPGHVFRCLTSLMDWRIGGFDSGSHDSPGLFNASCAAAMETFCDPGAANSVDPLGGLLSFTGSGSLLVNDNALVASNVPDFFGVFVQADDRGAPIMSPIGGNLCLRGTFERMNTIVAASGQQATLPLDFSDASLVENSTQAGVTEYYQFFHRDTLYPGGGNWTNALAVTWAP
ncbi:MAG: hypothetical protein AAF957_06065 [Planctomycetota bacterium]